ncbi:MAG: hypothetical protein ACRDNG_12425 [Gaiellaceae bacterium]
MTAITAETENVRNERWLRTGSGLMSFGALAFVGYGVAFFVLNFTDSFLELGIGREQIDVGATEIQAFSPDLYHHISHLHIAVFAFIAATGVAVFVLSWFGVRRGLLWAWVGAVAAPVIGLAVALPAHYPGASRRSRTWGRSTSRGRSSSSGQSSP